MIYPAGWTGVLTYGNGSVILQLQASQAAPPSTITDLAAGSATASTVTLTWTAPGAPRRQRYGRQRMTSAAPPRRLRRPTGTDATPVDGEPAPQPYGTPQSMVVSGLTPDTTWHFAIKSVNEVPATSALSNVPSALTQVSDDVTAPAAIVDLAANYPGSTHLILTWTAPGDDADIGTAGSYDIRYSTSPITGANWSAATTAARRTGPAGGGHEAVHEHHGSAARH